MLASPDDVLVRCIAHAPSFLLEKQICLAGVVLFEDWLHLSQRLAFNLFRVRD